MGDRDDKHIKNFKSRSQQPKQLASAPSQPQPMNINVFVYDGQRPQTSADEIENRFMRMGSNIPITHYNQKCQRHNIMNSFGN